MKKNDKKLAIIGCGRMGEAILENLLKNNVFKSKEVIVSVPKKTRCQALKKKYKVRTIQDNREAAKVSQLVLLAIKPQQARTVFKDLRGILGAKQTVISIMAGISIESLKKGLGTKNIIRAMPNTPVQICQGVTAWKKTGRVDIGIVKKMFKTLGKEIEVKQEKLIDAAAAVFGSGPAYIYLFMEHFTKIAKNFGFSEKEANSLVAQTFSGAIQLLFTSKKSPSQLREAVTSKKGTTEAALKVFKRKKLEMIFSEALKSTIVRANQLKRKYG